MKPQPNERPETQTIHFWPHRHAQDLKFIYSRENRDIEYKVVAKNDTQSTVEAYSLDGKYLGCL